MDPMLPPELADRPEFAALMTRLREELELGNHYLAGMAFVVLEVDDTLPAKDEATLRERLLKRALVATERSIRLERGIKRKVADFAMRIDRYVFVSLGAVSAGTLKVPLSRLANQIRNEFYSTADLQAMRVRRTLSIGVAHWLPEVGFITEQAMFEKAWQALQQAKIERGHPDPYGFLGLAASNMDTIRLQVFDWGQGERPVGKATATVRPSTPSVNRAPVVKTAPEKPAKKGWMFWK